MSRKRNNNEGTIYKKKDGKFRAQITIDGRRISHTANTWKECNVWRKKMISQLDEGLTYSGTKLTCKLFFSDWLSSKKGELQSSSSRQYDLVVRAYLIPNLGKIKLQNLRNDHIQRVYNRLRETGTGIPTIQKTHTVLHSALAYAVKTGLIVRNPASGVIVPKEPQKEMQILDETQVSQFLIAVIGHRWESLYFLAITSGMRQLEILGLKWSDVDWERQTIKVDRQLERSDGDGIKFTQPKTKYGRRVIDLGSRSVSSQKVAVEQKINEKHRHCYRSSNKGKLS